MSEIREGLSQGASKEPRPFIVSETKKNPSPESFPELQRDDQAEPLKRLEGELAGQQLEGSGSPDNQPSGNPVGEIVWLYQGAYWNKIQPNLEVFGEIARAADLRSIMVIKSGAKTPERDAVYFHLGDVAIKGGLGNPLEWFRRRKTHKGEETEILFQPKAGRIEIIIHGELVNDSIPEKLKGQEREQEFNERLDYIIKRTLKEAVWEEKKHQLNHAGRVVGIVAGLEVGGAAFISAATGLLVFSARIALSQRPEFAIALPIYAYFFYQTAVYMASLLRGFKSYLANFIPKNRSFADTRNVLKSILSVAEEMDTSNIFQPGIENNHFLVVMEFIKKMPQLIGLFGEFTVRSIEHFTKAEITKPYFNSSRDINPIKHLSDYLKARRAIRKSNFFQ